MSMLIKDATLIPPDGRIVFGVLRDMEWIIVIISDSAGNELLRIPIERPEHLKSGATARTVWDGRFLGWKGTGKGKWYRADPARANYYYVVVGEPKVEIPATGDMPFAVEDLPVPPEITAESISAGGMPTWAWIAIGGAILLMIMKRRT